MSTHDDGQIGSREDARFDTDRMAFAVAAAVEARRELGFVLDAPSPLEAGIAAYIGAPRGGGETCALCHGDGMVCNPGNGDPAVKVTEWLYPVGCPRCGGSGKDPNP